MAYLLSNLQDEETPKASSKFDGSDEKKSLKQVVTEYFTSHPSIIDTLFSGIMKTVVECSRCNQESRTFNPIMTLSLAFESSLDKAIKGFLQEVVLDKS